jgi:hypothetical protein
MQIRANFLQTRASQQQQDLKHSELNFLNLSRQCMKLRQIFKVEGAGDYTIMKDFIFEDAHERIRDFESQIKLIKHNNEIDTAKISGMVIYF